MILTELIKKLEELNSESANSIKPVKLIYSDSGVGIKIHIEIRKVDVKKDCIELRQMSKAVLKRKNHKGRRKVGSKKRKNRRRRRLGLRVRKTRSKRKKK